MEADLSITTAVIPVAGIGTRMLPATWSIEKCMLPIYAGGQTRLLVDWMVEECAAAGLERVIFVTTERGKKQLRDYFENIDDTLKERYEWLGKMKLVLAEQERRAAYGLHYEYIIQAPGAYGTTVPPFLARSLLRGEKQFFVVGGDDFVYHQDPSVSELALAIKTWQRGRTDHVIMGNPIDRSDGPKSGVLEEDERGNLRHWLEKAPLEELPDTPKLIGNISRYGFSDNIWDYMEQEMTTARDGAEHYITYPVLRALVDGQTFRIHTLQGRYLGGGTPKELIEAGQYIAAHPRR
jgi:UTP--glucose-1-phosphate uridylyltransferase